MPKSKRIAIYTRLSKDPTGQAESPKNHVAACRAYIEANGMEVAGEPFIDRDISGYKDKVRPAFNAMLAGVEAGDFDGVCVFKIDRFSRRMSTAVPYVRRIQEAGGVFLSVND